MILIYTNRQEPTGAERELVRGDAEKFSFRSAAYWKGEVESGVTKVYTDSPEIAGKYSKRGVIVEPITKPSSPKDAKPKTTRKRAVKSNG